MKMGNLINTALSHLNPSNEKTPVLGAIRKASRKVFGKQDYSPESIGIALGTHGGGLQTKNASFLKELANKRGNRVVDNLLQNVKNKQFAAELLAKRQPRFIKDLKGKFAGSK